MNRTDRLSDIAALCELLEVAERSLVADCEDFRQRRIGDAVRLDMSHMIKRSQSLRKALESMADPLIPVQ